MEPTTIPQTIDGNPVVFYVCNDYTDGINEWAIVESGHLANASYSIWAGHAGGWTREETFYSFHLCRQHLMTMSGGVILDAAFFNRRL